ncbi:MAG: hypothetical protein SGPRY_005735 [Prymnesium sp.]
MALTFFEHRSPTALEYACVLWFNLWLFIGTILVYVLSLLTLAPFGIWPYGVQRRLSSLMLLACRLFWRWPFTMSPWVRTHFSGLEAAAQARLGSSGRPVLIAANHTSFLDALLFASHINYATMARLAALASSHLFKIPLLGTVIRSVGHIPVFFKDHKLEQDFSTDQSKKALMLASIERHVKHGGYLCMYPEGQIHRGHGSPNTRTLQPFRVGGLKIALEYDMELWAWVSKGNNDCWPRTAVGGLPSTLKTRLVPIAPAGCCQLLRGLEPSLANERDAAKLMAHLTLLVSHVQTTMQTVLDELYDEKDRGD